MRHCTRCGLFMAVTVDGLCVVCAGKRDERAEAAERVQRAVAVAEASAAVLTPYELGFLLHYVGHAGSPPLDYWPPSQVRDATGRKLLEMGLLEHGAADIQTSPRGRAYIDSLLRVPLPEAVWVTRWPQP